jgi:histidinol dehydrogenase
MQLHRFPSFIDADRLLARPSFDLAEQRRQVGGLLDEIRRDGTAALRRLAGRFDGIFPDPLELPESDLAAAAQAVPPALQAAIRQAYANIRAFHEQQWEVAPVVETLPGVRCWRRSVPIGRVGLYVPGGTAPLFSTVLMLGVPAQLAGCPEIVLCTPPRPDGSIHPAILFAAGLCGIRRVFRLGGVQAIGAMAYGTAPVPRVWKIFGPGNSWVTAAKQLVSLDGVAIDLPAGPSEVAVVADAAANPAFIAADLLSQAEHGADSQVLLVSDSEALLQRVLAEIDRQLATLPRCEIASAALANSRALLVSSLEEAFDWVNAYAPEHLLLHVDDAGAWTGRIVDAGSVFIGAFSPESAGDYASGTNHTLPTGGYARAYGGVSLDSFLKKITFQEITPAGLERLGPTITTMARAEGLEAHARAVEVRRER